MIAHAFNPIVQEVEAGGFKASLVQEEVLG